MEEDKEIKEVYKAYTKWISKDLEELYRKYKEEQQKEFEALFPKSGIKNSIHVKYSYE